MTEYLNAWSAINTMLENGRSLSGYERHCAFLNTQGSPFANVSTVSGLDLIDDGRGIGLVDWNFDGKVDLWTTNRTAPWVRLLQNQSETDNDFVSIKLKGTTCNRSAIGARLELHLAGEEPSVQYKTLRAGEGFVSQSSKRLVFGISKQKRIEKLVVHWPEKSSIQTFHDLSKNHHYVITQGNNQAERWTSPGQKQLPSTEAALDIKQTDRGRISFFSRVSIPDSMFLDLDGNPRTLQNLKESETGKPTLVNLWATWCPPCLTEMKQWTAHSETLNKAGIRIVALSVDALGEDANTDRTKIKRLLTKLDWPFEAGFATDEFVSMLEVVNRSLVDKPRRLPVPTSILLDRRGRVAYLYRGPVEVDQLLADVQNLKDSSPQRLDQAAHFPGRWFSPPADAGVLSVVKNLIRLGHLSQAQTYLVAQSGANEGIRPEDAESAQTLGEAYHSLATAFRNEKENSKAIEAYMTAVKFSPDQPRIYTDLGVALYRAGDISKSVDYLEKAVKANAQDLNLRRLLVDVLARTGHPGKTLEHVTYISRATPKDPIARVYLAKALIIVGRSPEAVDQFNEAMRLKPGWLPPLNELAWLLATSPDDRVRNGKEALRLAQQLNEATGHSDPRALDTLAASFAESGDFPRAIETVQKAILLAKQRGDLPMETAFGLRLQKYQNQKAYREKPAQEKAD